MSFILDALRKSESERHRLELASLAELRMQRRRKRPWWMIALAVLLVANLGLLAAIALQPKSAPATAAENSTPPAPAANNPAPAARSVNSSPNHLTLAQLADVEPQVTYEAVDRSVLEAANAPPATPPLVRSLREANAAPDAASAIHDQPLDSIADLHLDMHVYAPTADNRFVFINKRKYTEGQTLAEGPRVEQITDDGVVLSYSGSRWRLRRP